MARGRLAATALLGPSGGASTSHRGTRLGSGKGWRDDWGRTPSGEPHSAASSACESSSSDEGQLDPFGGRFYHPAPPMRGAPSQSAVYVIFSFKTAVLRSRAARPPDSKRQSACQPFPS